MDIIFTFRSPFVNYAQSLGFKVGVRSDKLSEVDIKPDFLDLNWKNPNLDKHLYACSLIAPKYVVAPDILDFQHVESILWYAEKLSKYAGNVIIVPKVDCISEIDNKFMIGYSMPTKYGACPFPEWYFQGRRIHLLGGNLRKQKQLCSYAAWDVVSIDGNGWTNGLHFGDVIGKNGRNLRIRNQKTSYQDRIKISLENIAAFWQLAV